MSPRIDGLPRSALALRSVHRRKHVSPSRLFHVAEALIKRTSTSDSSSSTTTTASTSCAPDDNSARCQKPTESSSNTTTLPIVLGVVIPIVIAIAIFLVLHRRHVRKLRTEDANDKHASLDYGMERPAGKSPGRAGRKSKVGPEMSANPFDLSEKLPRRPRGLSMDMGTMGSPYLLPPGLQSSRESLHSLTRTMPSGDDRYRPATAIINNDPTRRSFAPSYHRGPDNASNYTSSSGGPDHMDQELLKHASRMSRSSPPSRITTPATPADRNVPGLPMSPSTPLPDPVLSMANKGLPTTPRPNGLMPPTADSDAPRDSYIDRDGGDMRRSNNYLGAFINPRDSGMSREQAPSDPPTSSKMDVAPPTSPPTSPPRNDRQMSPPRIDHPTSPPTFDVTPPPAHPERKASRDAALEMPQPHEFVDDSHHYEPEQYDEQQYDEQQYDVPQYDVPQYNVQDYDAHQEMGDPAFENVAKPLPEPPAQRRSLDIMMPSAQDFSHGADEVPAAGFDLRRLSMGFRPLPPEDPSDDPEQRANRIRSFYKEYFDESKPGPFPQDGAYYEDYGQEYLRDAAYYDPDVGNFVMAGAPYAEPITRRAMTPPPRAPPRFRGPPRSQGSSMSGLAPPPGPRAYSSASGRFGPMGPGGRGPPRKALPPPSPLRVLPTPHALSEDAFALPIGFAPPKTFKDRAAGRPDSPRGMANIPAHLPLASAFDDLSVMPSPHALRRSGTFTALDFAPPPRFKTNDTASDAGSIRSNRSAMSAKQLHSIRAGAYRVSRIPKEVVGTKVDLMQSLRPTWDMKT
ncbi:MAG: hypothetical protein M1838_001994 [Thelocarpon superellum]|nr:MAG: hypothetical protein M1838_001994 [Thelocarpon superellum]